MHKVQFVTQIALSAFPRDTIVLGILMKSFMNTSHFVTNNNKKMCI